MYIGVVLLSKVFLVYNLLHSAHKCQCSVCECLALLSFISVTLA